MKRQGPRSYSCNQHLGADPQCPRNYCQVESTVASARFRFKALRMQNRRDEVLKHQCLVHRSFRSSAPALPQESRGARGRASPPAASANPSVRRQEGRAVSTR